MRKHVPPNQHRTCFSIGVKFRAVCLAIGLAVAAYWYLHRPISYPPGVLIADEPSQLELPPNTPSFSQGAFTLKPLAAFTIDARVLHRKLYADRGAALVPVDLALGWGRMSRSEEHTSE